MKLFCTACILFGMAFVLHLIVWRIKPPARPLPWLVVVLLGGFPLGMFLMWSLQFVSPPGSVWEYAHLALFHVALSLAYIDVYPGLERRSPRMTIAALVHEAGAEGLTAVELHDAMGQEMPLNSRVTAMVADGLLSEKNDVLVLTPKGRGIGMFFLLGSELARLERNV